MFNCSASLTPRSVGALPGEKTRTSLRAEYLMVNHIRTRMCLHNCRASPQHRAGNCTRDPMDSMLTSSPLTLTPICSTIQAKVGSLTISKPSSHLWDSSSSSAPCLFTSGFSESLLVAAVSHRKCVSAPLLWHVPTTQHTRCAAGALSSHCCDEEKNLCAESQGWPLTPAAEQESAESRIARDRSPRNSQKHIQAWRVIQFSLGG